MITADGYVRPLVDLADAERAGLVPSGGTFAWFTDLDVPIRDALGLTSTILACDRTRCRFRVTDASTVTPWVQAAARRTPWGQYLEQTDGARPMHWYVSTEPVPVIEAPRAE